MKTVPRLVLCVIVLGLWGRCDALIDGFEQAPERWGKGLQLSHEHCTPGQTALEWPADRRTNIGTDQIPPDWTAYRALAFRCFSEKATGNLIMLTVTSENPQSEGGDYFIHTFPVDWVGWRDFEIPLKRLAPARQPLGWDKVSALALNSQGWSQEKVVPGTRLFLDDMRLLDRPPEELAEIRRRQHEDRFGRVARINDEEDLLELFARGGNRGVQSWHAAAVKGDRGAGAPLRQDWHALALTCRPGDVSCGLQRDYDLDLSPYSSMLIQARTSLGASLQVILTSADGEPLGATAQEGTGEPATLLVPLRVGRLTGMRLELQRNPGAPAGEPSVTASLEWIKVRRPERPSLDLFSHHTRAVLLGLVRPSWGAAAYRLRRGRGSGTADSGAGLETVGDAIPASTPVLCDVPPEPGDWRYVLVPLVGGQEAAPGPVAAIRVGAVAPPVIRRPQGEIVIDGDVGDWDAAATQSPLLIAGKDCLVNGAAPETRDDLSATAVLAHDETRLLISFVVRDEIVRHDNAWSWEGDGVVVMLLFTPPASANPPARYDLVLNCTAAGEARVLEDRARVYPPDAKPAAPGVWAAKRTDHGYTVEGSLPFALLAPYGFDPQAGGMGVGLVLFDADQADGPTTRQSILSWNQREKLYAPAEAAVVVWE